MSKRKKIFFILAVAVGIVLCYNQKNSHEQIFLDNVEALASGEGGNNTICLYNGSVDCRGSKAMYVSEASMPLPNK